MKYIDDAAFFEFMDGSAYVDNGANRVIRLFLFESSSKTINVNIAMQTEGSGLVNHLVPVCKMRIKGIASSARRVQNISFVAKIKSNVAPFLSRAVTGRMRRVMLCRNVR